MEPLIQRKLLINSKQLKYLISSMYMSADDSYTQWWKYIYSVKYCALVQMEVLVLYLIVSI